MCGIVGHLGSRDSLEVILTGLERLEYRGYDSAGVALCEDHDASNLIYYKALGKISELKDLLIKEKKYPAPFPVKGGIGHIRWATHGGIEERNAHPHGDETLSIVHNGIIENYRELKKELEAKNYHFKSDTDSEVFFLLLRSFLDENYSLEEATSLAFKKIEGHSTLLVYSVKEHKLLAIKREMALVCAAEEGEVFVSSDPYALVGMAKDLYFPHDNILVVLDAHKKENSLLFYDLELKKKEGTDAFMMKHQELMMVESSKGTFEHFMLKEIHQQPQLMKDFYDHYHHTTDFESLKKLASLNPSFIHIVACGTAYHAGLLLKGELESKISVPVEVSLASEFRYRNPLLPKESVGIFISQSGETADTLAAQHYCKNHGIVTIAIVNAAGSTLHRQSDFSLLTYAGREIGVASTKAFTQQVLTGSFLAQLWERKNEFLDFSNKQWEGFLEEKKRDLLELTFLIESLLTEKATSIIKMMAQKFYLKKGFIFTGRGSYFPIALEGALKLKEIAYVHAEGYASGELKHGPLALMEEAMVNIALCGPELLEKSLSNVEEVRTRQAQIVMIGPHGRHDLREYYPNYIPLQFTQDPLFNALYANVALQLFSYYIAKLKGTDIDRPRNLAKSVTVE